MALTGSLYRLSEVIHRLSARNGVSAVELFAIKTDYKDTLAIIYGKCCQIVHRTLHHALYIAITQHL